MVLKRCMFSNYNYKYSAYLTTSSPVPFSITTKKISSSRLPTTTLLPRLNFNSSIVRTQVSVSVSSIQPSSDARLRRRHIKYPQQADKGQKRFWKEVHVREVDYGLQIYLDTRPLRRSNSKILTIPSTKPHLATAIALEWDFLDSARHALKPHLTPLTSLTSRALDIAESDATQGTTDSGAIRNDIVKILLRYLDTDSLLCWAPNPPPEIPGYETHVSRIVPLRQLQRRTAEPIITFLEEKLWPGISIKPVLEEDSIIPRAQSPETRLIIRNWVHGLNAFNLAALERATLAGKGILGAARLVAEWGEDFQYLTQNNCPKSNRFGVEEAAAAASLEMEWQIKMWGLVEDTHDVEREDLRRQLGSVILLVSG
ncbi:Protein atp12, mitochondrial [Erysiphe neolycopersici]|uniref:Protein atp12, mitochondrial n=1 Tax=Erysiphe neolycopersici TaxID=212602 RepID=A0A420HM67_9PEZI|nr:Protein atp12, mitochondrial [Erysiphe neolycopersici]